MTSALQCLAPHRVPSLSPWSPHLDTWLQQLPDHYIISLVSLTLMFPSFPSIQTLLHCSFLFSASSWLSPAVTPPPFSPAPCSCDPQAWRRGERGLAVGSSGHLLPHYPRLRLGYGSSSCSLLYLPAPPISCPPPPLSLRLSTVCTSPSLHPFLSPSSCPGSPEGSASFPPWNLPSL